MAPGFPVAGVSQVLGSVNSGVAAFQARLVPNIFCWSIDFSEIPSIVLSMAARLGHGREPHFE